MKIPNVSTVDEVYLGNHSTRVKQLSIYFTYSLGILNKHDNQTDNMRKHMVLRAKEYTFICITIFVTFLQRLLHDYDVKLHDKTFVEYMNTRQILLSLSRPG